MIWPGRLAPAGRGSRRTATREPSPPTSEASIPTSPAATRVERLLLRAHDRLQRRVARLVDRVADRDHGRELDLDRVVAVLGLALAAQRAAVDVHLDHLRQRRHLQVVGDDRADRVALAVVGLLAEQHEVGLLLLERLRRARSRSRPRPSPRARRRSGAASGRRPATPPCAARAPPIRGPSSRRRSPRPRPLRPRGSASRPRSRACRTGSGSSPLTVHPPRRGIDALLDGGVRDLFDQDANLQRGLLIGSDGGSILPG